MAVPEYAGWARFLAEDPPGDVRTHALLATLCALVANALLAKGQQPKTALDFMPWVRPRKPPSTAKQAKEVAEAAQAAANAAQVRALQASLRAQREAADS